MQGGHCNSSETRRPYLEPQALISKSTKPEPQRPNSRILLHQHPRRHVVSEHQLSLTLGSQEIAGPVQAFQLVCWMLCWKLFDACVPRPSSLRRSGQMHSRIRPDVQRSHFDWGMEQSEVYLRCDNPAHAHQDGLLYPITP